MDFQQRARLADAAVWAALKDHLTGPTPKDVEAALSGAVAALTRAVWMMTDQPTVTQTVEAIREMACGAAVQMASAEDAPPRTAS